MGLTNLSQTLTPTPTPISTPNGPSTAETGSPSPGLVVPVYSSWFEFGKINDIERRSLPEFFVRTEGSSNDKTPSTYLEYRDFMVSQYRGRPQEYLSVTMCRRHLTGDVGTIVRVHNFLEQWGLVNFQVDIPVTKRERGVHVPASTELPAALSNAVQAASLQFSNPIIPLRREAKIICTCGVECPRLYYTYCPAGGDATVINLCALCYAEGKYPSNLYAGDFVKVDVVAIEQTMRATWKDEDIVNLLSAVEEFSGDWEAIAHKVGRPKDQCIFQFLRLPSIDGIGSDTILDSGETLAKSIPSKAIPFSTTENPIMSTLAFLASAVHPKVAASAAQAAIREASSLRQDSIPTDKPLANEDLSQIAATGIACAAARANIFADEETKKMARFRDSLVDLQLQKLRVKMSLYEDLERGLEEDRKELEQQRLQLFFDRFNLKRQMLSMEQKAGLVPDTNEKLEIESDHEASGEPTAIREIKSEDNEDHKKPRLTKL